MREDDVYQRQGFGADLPFTPPAALLVVDFVNAFADPAQFGSVEIIEAIERTVDLLAWARRAGWPVAFSRVVYGAHGEDANIFSCKVPGLLTLTEDAPGSAVVSALQPQPGEYVFNKTTPSAFHSTRLAPWLTERGIRTVAVVGATTSGCIRATVLDAMCAGFLPFVVSDCVADRAIGPHEANLFDMRQKYATVLTRDELLAQAGGAAA